MPNLIHVSKPYGQPVLVLLWISYPASLNLTDLISLIQESLPCFPHEPEITMVHWDDWREVSQITLYEAERWSTTGRGIDTLRNWYIKCHPFVGIKACNKNVSIFFTRSHCLNTDHRHRTMCCSPLVFNWIQVNWMAKCTDGFHHPNKSHVSMSSLSAWCQAIQLFSVLQGLTSLC